MTLRWYEAHMGIKKLDTIWIDGALVPWDNATDHLLAHTMHYGVGAFEGIRAYQRADGKTAIFRLQEHIERLFDSAHICTMDILVGPPEKPGFDMTDLATGGRDLVGAHVDWDDATSRDP